MREVVCRRYVLRMVKEAMNAQTTASESPRPSKRRKPNPHSADVLSTLASPLRKKSARSDTPSTPKGRSNHDIGSSDDDIKQEEPLTSKAIPQSN